jgi:hypothetical protein
MTAMLARYIWNLKLCESLYPALHNLEVAVRNTIHNHCTIVFGTPNWLELPTVLRHRQQTEVLDAKRSALNKESIKMGRRTIQAGDIIAELSFGFWTSLFNESYKATLWRNHLNVHKVFPYTPAIYRGRSAIGKRLNKIRVHLRNRVFHHEPIWNNPSLSQIHQELLDVIGWINPASYQITMLIDNFSQIYSFGEYHYQSDLQSCIDKIIADLSS